MPQITLASSLVAYNLYDKIAALATGVGHPRNVTGLHFQFPDPSYGAAYNANAAGILTIGKANAGATTIADPDLVMQAGESERWPGDGSNLNMVSLTDKWLQASVNNAVINVTFNVG